MSYFGHDEEKNSRYESYEKQKKKFLAVTKRRTPSYETAA